MMLIGGYQLSLKSRISLLTLIVFLLGVWLIALFATQRLQRDMLQLVGTQQFSAVSANAALIDKQIESRVQALKRFADEIPDELMNRPAGLQRYLTTRNELFALFGDRIRIVDSTANIIASQFQDPAEFMAHETDRKHLMSALADGQDRIGRPFYDPSINAPSLELIAPIHDRSGQVIGAAIGTVSFGEQGLLDILAHKRLGATGGYLLIAPEHGLIVTGTDRTRIMTSMPPRGININHDRFVSGYEGFGVAVNSRGIEEIAAAKQIPSVGWFLVGVLPTADALAPLRATQRTVLWAAAILSVLAGLLIWFFVRRLLRRQFAPMFSAARAVSDMARPHGEALRPLPVRNDDELGRLIGSFNLLIESVRLKEEALKKDIIERKRAEESLRLAASVFTHAREGITITDRDANILDVNAAFTDITGYDRAEVLGKNPRILSSGKQDEAFYSAMWQTLLTQGYWSGEVWNRHRDGRVFAEILTISAVRDENGEVQNFIALFSDITALKEHQKQLEHIAHYDALTGLPNRLLLADRLRQAMIQSHRNRQFVAVGYLDLDGFKSVNDAYGHQVGDQLLSALAKRIADVIREGDTLSRIGGDEFVAILADLPDRDSSLSMITRLLDAASEPVLIGEVVLQVSASLGVAFYPQTQEIDADQLLRQADQAMYQAKQAGKNRYHIFDAEQDRHVRGRFEHIELVKLALLNREFTLHYQPKVNMRTGTVVGAEALIRWQHPERGMLPPSMFLPDIENHPLAIELGEWVIDTALDQIETWSQAGLPIPISVNIGALQLQHPGFVSRLRGLLARHSAVSPEQLELEILETSALDDIRSVSGVMHACRELGVRFALDDFGTGYSSLLYLKQLPARVLKIDQGFVRDMLDDPDDLAILEGVLGMATAFRRHVVAEGVETIAHGEMLIRMGCEWAQGYGIARPMPADELLRWASGWVPPPQWSELQPLSRERQSVLFAVVEHRAWMTAMADYLSGRRENAPEQDHHHCRFGRWLDQRGRAMLAEVGVDEKVDTLHLDIHRVAETLLKLKHDDCESELKPLLVRLRELSDEMIRKLGLLY